MELADGTHYSYGDLEQISARIAGVLVQQGVQPGDRVAVQVEKSPQALFLYLACLRAGAIYLPLNTGYTRAELEYFLSDAEPALVVSTPQQIQVFCEIAGTTPVLTLDATGAGSVIDLAADQNPEFETVARADDDVAVILYTSGTTGRPKGAMITHDNLAANGLALQQAWQWRSDDVLLHALPIFHIHGLFVACHSVLLGGSSMLFVPKFDADVVTRMLPRATVLMGVPTFYTRLLAQPAFGKEACRGMRLFISGSAPLLAQTFSEFEQRTGYRILERYGMTETGMNTSNPVDGERIPGTVGLPLPGVSVRVVDDDDRVVAAGTVGGLQVKGANVFRGYWRMPEKTVEEFTADGWFRTGDLAVTDVNGYVSIVGRSKDMVITGGYNVYPKEIETLIDDTPGVLESAVIGLPHPDLGEAVTAIVVRSNGAAQIDEATLMTALRARLAGYKVPKRILFVDALPRNTMGKVQKNRMRDSYASLY